MEQPKILNISIDTVNNKHMITIHTEGDALLCHNAFVRCKVYLESLFETRLKEIVKEITYEQVKEN
jgi:hypothetical protein